MSMHVQNQSLSILGVETGLTGSPIGMPGVHGAQTGLTDTPTGLTGPTISYNPILENSASSNLEHDNANVVDWRIPIIDYLQDPSRKVDRKIRQFAFKFTLVDGESYRLTVDDLLWKCLDSDQAKVAMGEVHEGICGSHQLAPKMKLLLWRGGFYLPTMIVDCFWYYNGCEEC
jgi:hypothetical protein